MSRIPQSAIDEVLSKVSIADVIGEVVRLQKRGGRLVGLCPFHNEKSPSFSVSPERGLYHCFGCGASGNTVGFVMAHDGLTFPEAIRRLAEKANVPLPEATDADDAAAARSRDDRARYDRVMTGARDYYQAELWSGRWPAAQEYLASRGVDRETSDRFGLGFAPPGWSGLIDALGTANVPTAWLAEAGMVTSKEGGSSSYDRFRNRVMFPIENVGRRVLAFSGRTLDPAEPAKYVNSPETAYYRKGNELYGLVAAAKAIRTGGAAVLVEGNFDVVSLHARGLTNVCAALGTAMTEAQARLLKRFTERVVLLYDGDAAGRKAARRALAMLQSAEMPEVLLAELPDGSDPDDFVRREGADALRRVIDGAKPMVDALLDDIVSRRLARELSARAAADAIAELLAPVRDPIVSGGVVQEAARRLQVDARALADHVRRQGAMLRTDAAGAPPEPEPRGSEGRGTAAGLDGIELLDPIEVDPIDPIEAALVELLTDDATLLERFERERLGSFLQHPGLRAFLETVAHAWVHEGGAGVLASLDLVDEAGVRQELGAVLARPRTIPEERREDAYGDVARRLKLRWLDAECARIEDEIQRLERNSDLDAAEPLYTRQGDLLRWLRELKQGQEPTASIAARH